MQIDLEILLIDSFGITFLDEISPNHKITDTINIQSFKQYNFIEQIPGEDILPKISKCCSIF